LDEFDVIFHDKRGRPSDFVYALIELEKDLAKKGLHLCVIGISNNVLSEYDIDDRVKSRIGTSEVFFAPYHGKDVMSILSERAKDAFADKIDDAVLQHCSKLASEEHGDARRAIDLLRVAAELASVRNQTITISHVDNASKELQKDRIGNILENSSYHFRRILGAIARITFLSGQDWHYTSVLVQQYTKIWRDGANLLTYRRVSEIIREIENTGLLVSQESSRGRHGYGKQYKLTISHNVVGKKIDASWWTGLIKTKEMHDELMNHIEKSQARSEDQRNKIEQKQATEKKVQHWNNYVWQEEDGTDE
jgi:cell division control protein 6